MGADSHKIQVGPDSFLPRVEIRGASVEGDDLVRPNTDVISTMKLQKSFSNQTWLASAELISSLSDGDGTLRPALSWQVDDRHRLQLGADLIWGDRAGLFGQFKDNNRVWLKSTWTL